MFLAWVRRAGMLEVELSAEDGALRTDLAADNRLAHKHDTKQEDYEKCRNDDEVHGANSPRASDQRAANGDTDITAATGLRRRGSDMVPQVSGPPTRNPQRP